MIVEESTYRPPWYLPGPDLQSIAPQIARNLPSINYRRERIDTADGDFLDLDWAEIGSDKLVIVVHGMEGHSRRPYMLGMVNAFKRAGWDSLAWNMRGCSEEPNRKPGFYHAGMTDDLEAVVARALANKRYASIALVGFSLGGNLILKYLGERGQHAPIVASVSFSVPFDLADCAAQLHRWRNAFYRHRFMRRFRAKVRIKAALMPEKVSAEGIRDIRDLRDFDARYTVQLHGFASVEEYWRENSCLNFLPAIAVPSLVVNGRNDPFLGMSCYPVERVRKLAHVFLELPQGGGHVGFPAGGGMCWSEARAVEFVAEHIDRLS
jgi:hypothetical protein